MKANEYNNMSEKELTNLMYQKEKQLKILQITNSNDQGTIRNKEKELKKINKIINKKKMKRLF